MSLTASIIFCLLYGLAATGFGWCLCLAAKRGDRVIEEGRMFEEPYEVTNHTPAVRRSPPAQPAGVTLPTRVCSCCKRQLEGTSNRPTGAPLPLAPNQSHGLCVECVRSIAQDSGLPSEAINQLEAQARKNI